jgi:hypothetical protein
MQRRGIFSHQAAPFMNIKPTTNCPTFDLYILSPHEGIEAPPISRGFSQISLSLPQARDLAQNNRQRGYATVIVPTVYRDAKLSPSEARTIALTAFETRKAERVGDTFGDLGEGEDEGGWWLFQADNLTAQEAGMIPGLVLIRVDKLLARPLSIEESRWVDRLQVAGRQTSTSFELTDVATTADGCFVANYHGESSRACSSKDRRSRRRFS